MRNGNTRKTALCGVLAALAVAVMFLGSSLSVATIASAVLARDVKAAEHSDLIDSFIDNLGDSHD